MAGRRRQPPIAVMPSSHSLVPALARTVHAVALSVWLGGLLAVGALTAPVTFHLLRGSSLLTLAQANMLAGQIVGSSLYIFNIACAVCGLLLLGANAALLPHAPRRPTLAALGLTLLLLLCLLFLGLYLSPTMDAARAQGNMATFDRLHHLYERIFSLVQLPLLLLLALCGALRDTLRR